MSSPSSSTLAKWTFLTLLGFAAFIFIAVFTGRIASSSSSYDDLEAQKRKETLRKLQDDEKTTMTTPDWVDKTKQIVRVPLDDAFGPALEALKAKPLHMAEEIPGSAPAPAPAPAPTPAPAPSPSAATSPSPSPSPAPSSHPSPTPSHTAKPTKPASKSPTPAPTKAAHKP